jgi:protein-S-isoprenylcysteine O-methyltransferase Ste14
MSALNSADENAGPATSGSPNKPAPAGSPASRIGILAFGLVAYAAFVAVILYAIGFVGGFIVPKTIDSGTPGPLIPSLLVNGALLSLFVVQHTIMARPGFKRWFTRFIPPAMERSIFVMAANLILALVFWQWRPLPEVVWSVSNPALANGLFGLSMLGWAVVLGSSFMVSHFDLFGLRQSMAYAFGRVYKPVAFRLVLLYRLIRHPLMLGFIIAFWATPEMTVGHLFFAIMTTGYILFGTTIEERDLVAAYGERYQEYRRNVRGLIPLPRLGRSKGPVE